MSLTLTRTDLLKEHNFIDGQWRDSSSGVRYDVADPASDDCFATVPASGADDALLAVAAAQAALPDWRASASGLPCSREMSFA
ncbi:aldehyde dehydrogenase family protein, partial [Massilia sp. CT11-108]|uniref:aldehyde dehydrogenase family protein n=1 Tax=Massilia sp. CT11-108 TaxID=3393900 RepID=UPI0039A48D22